MALTGIWVAFPWLDLIKNTVDEEFPTSLQNLGVEWDMPMLEVRKPC